MVTVVGLWQEEREEEEEKGEDEEEGRDRGSST